MLMFQIRWFPFYSICFLFAILSERAKKKHRVHHVFTDEFMYILFELKLTFSR